MLNLGGWLSKLSEDLNNSGYDDVYDVNGSTLKTLKGFGKWFLSGTIDGITNIAIVDGFLLMGIGIIAMINNKKSEN